MTRRPQATREQPKTAWGRFLLEQRLARGQKQTEVFRSARQKLGWGELSNALYGDMERGKREPTPEERDYFLALYAPAVPEPEAEPKTEGSDLGALASALHAIAEELRLAREERAATGRRMARLEAEVIRLGGTLEGPEPDELAAQRMYDEQRRPRVVPPLGEP